jgi:two-component system NtrC family sensor kinase
MKRILVVDDDDGLRTLLSTALSQDGRAVDAARDGIEAVALLGQHHYDLILSDLVMPGLDGPALYEALRAVSRPAAIPRVIFMTGNVGGGAHAAFLRETTEPMLEKPFSLDVVRHLVNVLLKERAT